jgi:Uma2 family endonuclease
MIYSKGWPSVSSARLPLPFPHNEKAMSKTAIRVGPEDHGRRMSLNEFEFAEGAEGHLYELSRGVVTVIDVPNPRHFLQVNKIRRQLSAYETAHRNEVYAISAGSDCKILLETSQSERHPDFAIYKTEMPTDAKDIWSVWIPEIVIEVVSESSKDRDYVEKREEYLLFGVQEYWIFDADKREMLVLKRSRGIWVEQVVRPNEAYSTHLLDGLEFHCGPVFDAADRAAR